MNPEKNAWPYGGEGIPSEGRQWAGGRQPWDDPIPSTTGSGGGRGGAEAGAGGGSRQGPLGASGSHWLLCACATLCVPGVAPIVVVPVVWRPLALVLIVLVPLLGILLILVIAGLRVGLCGGGWRWGIGSWVVTAVAPIVVGRWWWRWRRWGCVALAVTSLVVGWLAVTRLWRAVAADGGGAGIGA